MQVDAAGPDAILRQLQKIGQPIDILVAVLACWQRHPADDFAPLETHPAVRDLVPVVAHPRIFIAHHSFDERSVAPVRSESPRTCTGS